MQRYNNQLNLFNYKKAFLLNSFPIRLVSSHLYDSSSLSLFTTLPQMIYMDTTMHFLNNSKVLQKVTLRYHKNRKDMKKKTQHFVLFF